MDENLVDEIGVVGNGNVNKKERNQMVFDHIADLERKKQGRSIGKIIDCCTKLGLDRSQVDDAIKKLLDGNLFRITHTTAIFAIKNFEDSNTDSYNANN